MSQAAIAAFEPARHWACHPWTDFAQRADKDRTQVIVPFFGLADWGLGHPLDVEEVLGTTILNAALARSTVSPPEIVTPPVRFMPAPFANQAFGLDLDTAYALAQDVLQSIQASGFQRVILFNTSPWGETFIDVVGRDSRITLGLQPFCVNLSGLGLDLHPARCSADRETPRRQAQTLATFLYDAAPDFPDEPAFAEIPSDASTGDLQRTGSLLTDCDALATARQKGPTLLESVSRELAGLLGEIAGRDPLPDDGRIAPKTAFP
ncbi:MAG: hypothetical protein ACFB20_10935 [Opitutales bacterium]